MSAPERGLKPDHETRLHAQNAGAVHPAEPREEQSTELRTLP